MSDRRSAAGRRLLARETYGKIASGRTSSPLVRGLLVVSCVMLAAACADGTADVGDVRESVDVLHEWAEPEFEPVEPFGDDLPVSRRLTDASIAARIRIALVEDQSLRVFEFDPVVADGRVVLRGSVRTQEQRLRAADLARSVDGVRDVVNEISAADEPVASERAPARSPQVADAAEYYTVRSGDSMWEIARRHGVSVEHVRQLNGMTSNTIRPGQRLRVR